MINEDRRPKRMQKGLDALDGDRGQCRERTEEEWTTSKRQLAKERCSTRISQEVVGNN